MSDDDFDIESGRSGKKSGPKTAPPAPAPAHATTSHAHASAKETHPTPAPTSEEEDAAVESMKAALNLSQFYASRAREVRLSKKLQLQGIGIETAPPAPAKAAKK